MATQESYVHDNIKQTMVKADERSSEHIFRSLRKCVAVSPLRPRPLLSRREPFQPSTKALVVDQVTD